MIMIECLMVICCMVLYVNGIVDVESFFICSCVIEKIFKVIKRGCINRYGCEIVFCI